MTVGFFIEIKGFKHQVRTKRSNIWTLQKRNEEATLL